MYTIYIADDNELARKALSHSVKGISDQYHVIGEAANGKKALKQIEQLRPDIALLDIRMPGLSGLEIMAELKKQGQNVHCILITAYDDFSYVKEGLKLNACDYLLKPVSDADLALALEKTAELVDKEEQATRQMAKNRETMREKFLQDLLSGYQDSAEKLKTELKDEWHFHDYAVMLVSVDDSTRDYNALLKEAAEAARVDVLSAFREEGIALLVSFRDPGFNKDYEIASMKFAEALTSRINEGGEDAIVAISCPHHELTEVHRAYEEARQAMESRYFIENRKIIHYESVNSKSIRRLTGGIEKMQELSDACEHTPEKIPEKLESLLACFSGEEIYDVTRAKMILREAGVRIGRAGGNMSEEEIRDGINATRTIDEAFSLLRKLAGEAAEQAEKDRGISLQTRKILNFIEEHYSEPLTLEDLQQGVGISQSHICRLLKSETGDTFTSVLNKTRVNAAIRLLRTGDYKVYEVGEMTGFSNYAYFYQVFKKIAGISPKDVGKAGF